MTNRVLSTGQGIFTLSLHIWPWDSSASKRSARRAKNLCCYIVTRRMIVRKCESFCVLPVAILDTSLRIRNISDVQVTWAKRILRWSRVATRVITFILFHKTNKAAIWSAHVAIERSGQSSVQKRSYYGTQFIRYSSSKNQIIRQRKNFLKNNYIQ